MNAISEHRGQWYQNALYIISISYRDSRCPCPWRTSTASRDERVFTPYDIGNYTIILLHFTALIQGALSVSNHPTSVADLICRNPIAARIYTAALD